MHNFYCIIFLFVETLSQKTFIAFIMKNKTKIGLLNYAEQLKT